MMRNQLMNLGCFRSTSFIHRDFHRSEFQGAIVGRERNVGCIASVADHDAIAASFLLHPIEGEPAPTHEGFKPCMEVHRFQLIE